MENDMWKNYMYFMTQNNGKDVEWSTERKYVTESGKEKSIY
jgi:hypothetical protein